MATCRLEVRLEKPDASYVAGEKVRGEVWARPDEDVACRAVNLRWFWSITGARSEPETGLPERIPLAQGPLVAGREYRWPFEFNAPASPPTTTAELFSLVWKVVAELDVPWAIDPKASTEIVVRAAPQTTAYADRFVSNPVVIKGGCGVAALVVFAAGALFFVGTFGLFAWEFRHTFFGWILVGVPVFAIVSLAQLAGRQVAAWWRLGKPEVSVDPGRARPGDAVTFRMRGQPSSAATIRAIRVELQRKEEVVVGSKGGTTTKVIPVTRVDVPPPPAGAPLLEIEANVPIPAEAAPTLDTRVAKLHWQVQVYVDLERWPDWSQLVEIVVD